MKKLRFFCRAQNRLIFYLTRPGLDREVISANPIARRLCSNRRSAQPNLHPPLPRQISELLSSSIRSPARQPPKAGLNNCASDRSHAGSTPGASRRQDRRRPFLNRSFAKRHSTPGELACLLQSSMTRQGRSRPAGSFVPESFRNASTSQSIQQFPKSLFSQLLNIPDISNCMNGKQYLSADKGIRSAGDPHSRFPYCSTGGS